MSGGLADAACVF